MSYGRIQILLLFPAHIYHRLLIELMPLLYCILTIYSSQLVYILYLIYVYILLLILPDFKHTTPIPLFKKKKRTPKLSKYKFAIHRFELLLLSERKYILTLPSSSHLEFNPLILSPKTVQGLQYSIAYFRKSRIQGIFISRPRFEIRENVNIILICMIHTI